MEARVTTSMEPPEDGMAYRILAGGRVMMFVRQGPYSTPSRSYKRAMDCLSDCGLHALHAESPRFPALPIQLNPPFVRMIFVSIVDGISQEGVCMATAKESAPKSLTKAQIIVQLSEKNALTKKQTAAFLESLVELAYRETKKNKKFAIPGLGILKLNKRKARIGRNPATGAQIKIPAKTVVKLTVSKACKDAILGVSK